MTRGPTHGQKKLASISHFQDYPIIPRTFIKASVAPMSQKFPTNFPKISQQISKQFTSLKRMSKYLKTSFIIRPTVKTKIWKLSHFVHLPTWFQVKKFTKFNFQFFFLFLFFFGFNIFQTRKVFKVSKSLYKFQSFSKLKSQNCFCFFVCNGVMCLVWDSLMFCLFFKHLTY